MSSAPTLEEVMTRMHILEAENSSLQKALALTEAQSAGSTQKPATRTPPPHQPHVPEPTVSLPDKFSGDRRMLRTFLNQLELVFLINPSKYHNDSIKVAYRWNTVLLGSLHHG
ncbi:hypothetical protein BASA81_010435 [Batrachochytrium salamandrivorans]|nr:hypothetical protein BASA81_010435 [Batrachochytrium salamandrivorans]